MKTFRITVRLLGDDRMKHHARIEAESLAVLIASMNENLDRKFFAIKARRSEVLTEYTAIINSAAVQDFIITELE